MRNWGRKLQGEQRGATLVWVMLAMVALIAMAALAVDGGYAYVQRRRMQNAADAAAIAGARLRALGGTTAEVGAVVNQYATANGATGVSWTYPTGQKIRVTASCSFPTFFAGIIGLWQMTASATGEASIQYLSEAGNLLPMIVEDRDFNIGQIYELWGDDREAPGNFGWLDWNGGSPSTPELADNIRHPSNSGTWRIGDWVPGGPGVKASSQVKSALNIWIGQHVTIPFYDLVQGQGNNTTYRIAGFGEFTLTDYDFQGNPKWVRGYFIRWVELGPGGGPNRGLASVKLTQ
ncbi:MAG: pilus assembly protein TadG-related protein [Anaerolineae bacterium]|nr:pilus assembly protein TadG-related protein [Anaerolineae bacterium]